MARVTVVDSAAKPLVAAMASFGSPSRWRAAAASLASARLNRADKPVLAAASGCNLEASDFVCKAVVVGV